jgi:hypothetical protein
MENCHELPVRVGERLTEFPSVLLSGADGKLPE